VRDLDLEIQAFSFYQFNIIELRSFLPKLFEKYPIFWYITRPLDYEAGNFKNQQ
jgi:hypothetical protein